MTASTPVQNGPRQSTGQTSTPAPKPAREVKTVVDNRQARHLFAIEDTLTAGLQLEGWEVKAILAGQANFNSGSAFVQLKDGEAWLNSLTITPMAKSAQGLLADLDPSRPRKLLLKRSEIEKLGRKVSVKGYTIVPLALTYNGKLKLEIGVAKGKKLADKREATKERDGKRDMAREVKNIRMD